MGSDYKSQIIKIILHESQTCGKLTNPIAQITDIKKWPLTIHLLYKDILYHIHNNFEKHRRPHPSMLFLLNNV